MIPFNQPCLVGNELAYIADAVKRGKISGNGYYTQACQQFLENEFGYLKTLLTNSCTDALEMAALLIDIKAGDEVIMPSFTHVSTANAFLLRGAKIVFADVEANTPNLDVTKIASLVNKNTKAIVVVHYGGIAVNMQEVLHLAIEHNLFVIEDAAAALGGFYSNVPLGSIGHLAAISFHETKNIQCGEGGLLIINDERLIARAEILWEKGTNRVAFNRGEIPSYDWMDLGSSFLPSELNAAYLYAQLEKFGHIQTVRRQQWERYFESLAPLVESGRINIITTPEYAIANYHLFGLLCANELERDKLASGLLESGILAVSHYRALHLSPFFKNHYSGPELPNAVSFQHRILRLPLFHDLKDEDIAIICDRVKSLF